MNVEAIWLGTLDVAESVLIPHTQSVFAEPKTVLPIQTHEIFNSGVFPRLKFHILFVPLWLLVHKFVNN